MFPIFADAINFPIVLGFGIAVLVPLLAFEVFVEAWVIGRVWNRPAKQLRYFAFIANCWSLLAGIPAKIANSFIYSAILPMDLPSYFAAYAPAMALGSFLYFAITVCVEGVYALRWRAKQQLSLAKGTLWKGILFANFATYAVLAPLHYFWTRPTSDGVTFANNAAWSMHPKTKLIFVDPKTERLEEINIDGSDRRVIVPFPVRDYLVSSNLNLCLYRGSDNNLHLHRENPATNILIWKTTDRFKMDQVAFSPSGRRVAFIGDNASFIEAIDIETNQRLHEGPPSFSNFAEPSIAWSNDEQTFYVKFDRSGPTFVVTFDPPHQLQYQRVTGTNAPSLFAAFGRLSKSGWWNSGDDWGGLFRNDEHGDIIAACEPGLASDLRVYLNTKPRSKTLFAFSVNPGFLHAFGFQFHDVAFLENDRECLFDTEGFIYLVNINAKQIGTITAGKRFILLSDRYRKEL